jgi:hypothetical protein
MFATRVAETVGVAQAAAFDRGRKDRERFVPFLVAVEEFARAQKRVIGGRAATLMLMTGGPDISKELPLDAFHLVVYSPDPMRDASTLARKIYALDPKGLAQYTVMLPRHGTGRATEASIIVAQREVARILGLPRYRGVHIYELISPEMRPGLFSDKQVQKTPCLGPEVQLLGSYSALCNPGRAGDWPQVLIEERRLREVFLANFEDKIQMRIDGGKPSGGRSAGGGLPELRRAIAERFLCREGRVWLVDAESEEAGRRPACVSVFPLAKEQEALGAIADKLGAHVHFLENDPQLLDDTQMRRLTLYFKRGEHREPILDVYNIASYEAFPYLRRTYGPAKTQYKLATAFGQARFLLVDVWTIQLLWKMESISESYAMRQLKMLLVRYRKLVPLMNDPETAFPALPTHFVGRIDDPELAGKRRAFAAGRAAKSAPRGRDGKKAFRPGPYFPAWSDRAKNTDDAHVQK